MNETKKMRSISRNINRSWVAGLFAVFLVFDILVTGMSVTGWCYFQETAKGQDFRLDTPRSIELLEKNRIPPEGKALVESAGWKNIPFKNALARVQYIHKSEDGTQVCAYMGKFLLYTWRCLTVILLIQLLILLFEILTGSRKARKHLAPLNEITQIAKNLTDAAAFDEDRFHQLEEALSRISPTGDAALHTGDVELEGLEAAVNNLLERMRQSYQQQARFVSDASHELRTPIAVIQGYANMLDRWGTEDEQILAESISAIKSESDNMKKLVEQLLFLARGDSGRTQLTMEDISLSEIIREVFDESVMIDQKHHYHLKGDGDIRIIGDSSMIKQAARILVDNAAKYTPAGADIILKFQKNHQGHSSFIVQDEGIGISGEDIPHMFERFFRSDPARSREGGGSGLGLSIAKWIVDRHGGYFQVLSREDIGTRITVSFPPQT